MFSVLTYFLLEAKYPGIYLRAQWNTRSPSRHYRTGQDLPATLKFISFSSNTLFTDMSPSKRKIEDLLNSNEDKSGLRFVLAGVLQWDEYASWGANKKRDKRQLKYN